MSDLIIYHNGQCSKSKGALELLIDNNVPHRVRWYLAEPLSGEELSTLLGKLSMQPSALVRRNEPEYVENYSNKELTEDEWLQILVTHPQLIERPIVERGDKAIVARPPERALELV